MTATLEIEGLSVGHHSDPVGMTGCTVVLSPEGAVAGLDIRGGAPGTLDTDLLSPLASVSEVHGLLLTGGSAPGLRAAAGVTRYLREKGLGYCTAFARIPLVAGAVIYDLGLGAVDACPEPDDAYAAAAEASTTFAEGCVGVGTGATIGKVTGHNDWMKSGLGFATVRVGTAGSAADVVTVSALTVVNAVGDVLAEDGTIMAGARREGVFLDSRRHLLDMGQPPVFRPMENTTLSVVMTDARLDKAQCTMVARASHDGMARSIAPVHTPVDGDCVFVLATGRKQSNVFQLATAGAEAVAASIRRAVAMATGCPGAPALCDIETEAAR